jgi:hypothetical protein
VVESFDSPVVGVMSMHSLNYSLRWTGGPWKGTTIGTNAAYGDASFAQIRAGKDKYSVIEDAGWHLSWFGGKEAVFAKVQANAHGEMAEDLDVLARQYDEHIWPGGTVQLWKYGGDMPRYVQEGLAPSTWGYRKPRAKTAR